MEPRTPSGARTLVATLAALCAFAANSLLCRKALGSGAIDAASFTLVRLASGAAFLVGLAALRRERARKPWSGGSWRSGAFLFLYGTAFSLAYRELGAGAGALVLFGMVQLTMCLAGALAGERPPIAEWCGLALAAGGLLALVLPGWSAPPLGGAVRMGLAGIAWGFYSLRGRGSRDALGDTAGNFARSVPFGLAASAVLASSAHVTLAGTGWAVLSGAVTSGLGYVVWYSALRGLTAVRAALVQLAVPILAALGGVLLLGEGLSLRLGLAAALVLGGIALATLARQRTRASLPGR